MDFRMEAVRLDAVLADLEAVVAPQVSARRIPYSHAADGEPLVVRADADRLTQILTNLLTNANKFTPEGGAVAVTCGAEGDGRTARLSVTDTGRGIPADQLERVFEPFVQVDRRLNPESQQGVGLGLAISRDLARAMGSDLTAASAPGAGSTFTLRLPRA